MNNHLLVAATRKGAPLASPFGCERGSGTWDLSDSEFRRERPDRMTSAAPMAAAGAGSRLT